MIPPLALIDRRSLSLLLENEYGTHTWLGGPDLSHAIMAAYPSDIFLILQIH